MPTFILTAELVPKPLWGKSLANLATRWETIRQSVLADVRLSEEGGASRCEICRCHNLRIDAHEVWDYDDINHVQTLTDILGICPDCHHVKHIGMSETLAMQKRLDLKRLVRHFCKVNRCLPSDFIRHRNDVFLQWQERSQHEWTQDFAEWRNWLP